MPTGMWLYSYLILWMLLLIESFLMIAVVRQIGSLYAYWVNHNLDSGLPLGTSAPALLGDEIFERPVSLTTERGKKTLVCFLSTSCNSCRQAIEEIFKVHNTTNFDVEIVLVIAAHRLKSRLFLSDYYHMKTAPDNIIALADKDNELVTKYNVNVFPFMVIVDEKGHIAAQRSVITLSEIRALLVRASEFKHNPQSDLNLVVS